MLATIKSVELIEGSEIHKSWQLPMTLIETNIGNFIDYGKNYEAWVEAESHGEMTIHTMPCDRSKYHTWAKACVIL